MKKSQDFVEKFSTILQKQGTITAKRAEEFKKLFKQRSKATFVEFLQEEGFVERKDLLNALSAYYEKPAFDVVGHFFDEHYVHMFPLDVMVRNVFIPLEREENVLVIVAGDPANEQLLPLIGNYVSYDIRFNVGLARDIIDAAREFSEYSIAEYPEMIDVGIKKEEQEANEVRRLVLEQEEQD